MAHKALGRGLDALFSSNTPKKSEVAIAAASPARPVSSHDVRDLAVASIRPNRHQPRTHFDPATLEELASSIKTHGLAQPLLVTETGIPGEYELVAGERRLRAAKMAGLSTVPCTIKKLSNRERFEVALIENIQRQDLNALEEAVALDGLMKEYDLTQEEVASAIGKSRSAVANILRYLRLHEDIQGALRAGTITEGHAKCLAGVQEHSEQLRWLEKILKEKLSVRDLEALLSSQSQKKAGTHKNPKVPLPEIQRYQEGLQRILGRRVDIQSAGKKGWLKFEFYNPEDLDHLCKKLGILP